MNKVSSALVAGDVKAFEEVFREYFRELYIVAMGLCNDRDVAEDAVQESFIYLWSHRDQVDVSYPVIGYLRTAVRNYILNYFRHQKVRVNREEEIIREQEFLSQEDDDLVFKIEMIRQAIDLLPENCRKAFVMAVIEGMSYEDTAGVLGISVNTVKSQIKIAYRKIKSYVQDNPDNGVYMLLFLLAVKKIL